MERSETITELCKALSAAQGEFQPATKGRTNPHLNSKYATLDDVIDAVRQPMKAHGLSFVQPLSNGNEGAVVLETVILHESGEWIGTTAHVPALSGNRGVNELQSFGGALTYMRRYMLTSMLGISSEEDGDGNSKPKARPAQQAKPQQAKPQPALTHWINDSSTRAGFWAWTKDKTLTHEQVHEALGVTSLKEFKGSKLEATNRINKWLSAQAEPLTAEAAQEELEL